MIDVGCGGLKATHVEQAPIEQHSMFSYVDMFLSKVPSTLSWWTNGQRCKSFIRIQ